MKQTQEVPLRVLVALVLLLILVPAGAALAANDITNDFTDANFLAAVREITDISSGSIYDTDVAPITSLDVNNRNIASLNGIEHFTALTYLNCNINQLTGLDVSKNTALQNLHCAANELTALDVSKNTALKTLSCSENQLTTLNLDDNHMLSWLDCENNQLTALDVSHNSALQSLYCYDNQLVTLNLNSTLTMLLCYNNQLTNINVANSTALKSLQCSNNQLANLDVSNNSALDYLTCSDNQLTALNVSNNAALKTLACEFNQLTALDVSHNAALTYLNCGGNELAALDVSKNTALTSLDCGDNELAALDVSKNTALTYFDCGGNELTALDVSENTALTLLECGNNRLTALDVSNNPLETLYCYTNRLTELDVSNNPALETLYCGYDQLTALDLSRNPALERLYCDGNQLISLNVSYNPSLTYLWVDHNYLPSQSAITGLSGTLVGPDENATDADGESYFRYTPQNTGGSGSVDITSEFTDPNFLAAVREITNIPSGPIYDKDVADIKQLNVNDRNIASLAGIEHFTALEHLNCEDNRLTALDVSNNPALVVLLCGNNQLTTLNLSNSAALKYFYCQNNALTVLDVSAYTALEDLGCNGNQLKNLDVRKNVALKRLYCQGNQLRALDVSNNPALERFYCEDNQLTTMDVSKNTSLEIFACAKNQLTTLNVSKNTALVFLNCSNLQLQTLDLSPNAALTRLYCQDNLLTALNVSNNPNLIRLWVNNNNLPSVSAIAGLASTRAGTDESAEMAVSDMVDIFYDSANYIEENGVKKYPKFLYTPQNTNGGAPGAFTLTQAGAVYGGQTLANPQVRGANSANIDYTYSGTLRDGVTAYGPSTVKPSEAGDYTVAGVDKTTGAAASVSFTIAPKALTLTGLSVETKTYDRTTAATLTGTPVLTGKVGADDVSVDRSGEAAVFDNAAAGTNKNVSVTGLALAGAKAFNYTLPAALTLKGEIKALSAGDAPLIAPDFSTPVALVVDTPPPYGNDPAADEQMWKMVYTLREDTAFRSVTPESSANLLFMDLALVLKLGGTPYSLQNGESLNVVFPYPSDAVAQNYKNYRFVLLHYTKAGEAETIPAKAESYGVEATLTELSPYALAWIQVSSGRGGGGGGGAAPVEPVIPGVTVSKASLTYISGINRVETSVAISRQGWTSAETVILAPGGQNNLIDALAVAPLAGQEKAPILLSTGSLDPAVVAEIQRLGAKKIYAVGAISQDVIGALEAALPGLTIETLRGANRFETTNLINARVSEPKGTFIVGYNAVADAVSAASFAAANGYAIQIASPDGSISAVPTGWSARPLPVADAGSAAIGSIRESGAQPDSANGSASDDHDTTRVEPEFSDLPVYILGGPTLVQDVPGATRLYGATRYETNKAVRDALAFDYTNIYTANGDTLVDALTGSALAAQSKAAIVLLPGNDPTGADFGKITQETKVYAFGAK